MEASFMSPTYVRSDCSDIPPSWFQRELNGTFTRPISESSTLKESDTSMTVLPGSFGRNVCFVYIDGALRVPITRDLRHRVKDLLRGGDTNIVLDLSRVARIDAAGIGELVRAYNMTDAANGLLQIVRPTPWVRDLLARVGL